MQKKSHQWAFIIAKKLISLCACQFIQSTQCYHKVEILLLRRIIEHQIHKNCELIIAFIAA